MRFCISIRAGLVTPDEGRKRAFLLGEFLGPLGIVDDGFDLAAMARNAGFAEQAIDVAQLLSARSCRSRSDGTPGGSSRACRESCASSVRTGSPRGSASRTPDGRWPPGNPIHCRGTPEHRGQQGTSGIVVYRGTHTVCGSRPMAASACHHTSSARALFLRRRKNNANASLARPDDIRIEPSSRANMKKAASQVQAIRHQ